MKAVIVNFRRNKHSQTCNHIILNVDGIEKREKAESLVGKEIKWTSPGKQKKEIKGKIAAAHGNKGAVRAIMEKGMPGQSLGQKIDI
ncbi:MAG: 50S ribosomal protein L35ae [Candidatus Woesearchaeota archaeon]